MGAMKARVSGMAVAGLISFMLAVATGVVGLFPGDAFAQSSTTLAVSARIVAPCTIASGNPQSTCSDQMLARQSDIRHGSARITTSGGEAAVTHKGGLPPKIEKQGNQLVVSF